MSRRVLVTGATGMVGGWLVRALLERGDRVVVLRRSAPGPGAVLAAEGLEARCVAVPGDLLDDRSLVHGLVDHEIDTIFHLAGQTIVADAVRAPLAAWEANVRGTYLLLEAARAAGVERTVVASSIRVYGEAARAGSAPPREDAPLDPRDPYGASKAAADVIARSYWSTHGMAVAVARASNVYGGGDRNRSRLVPEAIDAALAGRAPVLRCDGTPRLNLLHVDDVVAAYLAIADALDVRDGPRTARGEAFNVGGEDPRAVGEIAALACRLAGSAIEPQLRGAAGKDAEPDAPDPRVDCTKLRERTGWRPRVSLEDGLAQTIAWHRAHGGGAVPAAAEPIG